MSMMVVGALAATSITTVTPLVFTFGGAKVELQKVLNQIFPKLIPLAILMFAFYLLKKKEKSPVYVLITLFIIGFVAYNELPEYGSLNKLILSKYSHSKFEHVDITHNSTLISSNDVEP
jgi:RsiW-degrading membrane proteinase PrsW (M82 family)